MLGKVTKDSGLLNRRSLIIMAKLPAPGRVKTRLRPLLTSQAAAELYRALTDDCVAASLSTEWKTHLWVHPTEAQPYFKDRYPDADGVHAQAGSDLGSRMENAFHDALRFSGPVVMRSSDSPLLPRTLITEAFTALEGDTDAVLSNDQDGGYTLIGQKHPIPGLFQMEMSTESVFEATIECIRRTGQTVELLAPCGDVDLPADLTELNRALALDPSAAPRTAAWLREYYPRKSTRTRQP